jgi:hypothetical protein
MGRNGGRPSLGKQMVRNDHWSFDQDLEGIRSLGAVLIRWNFVLPQKAWANIGHLWVSRLQGTAALQTALRALLAAIYSREGRAPLS